MLNKLKNILIKPKEVSTFLTTKPLLTKVVAFKERLSFNETMQNLYNQINLTK